MKYKEIKELLKSEHFWNGVAKGGSLAWLLIFSSFAVGITFGLGFHMSITILENLS